MIRELALICSLALAGCERIAPAPTLTLDQNIGQCQADAIRTTAQAPTATRESDGLFYTEACMRGRGFTLIRNDPDCAVYESAVASTGCYVRQSPSLAPVQLNAQNPDADYKALAPGALYIGPDGHVRRK